MSDVGPYDQDQDQDRDRQEDTGEHDMSELLSASDPDDEDSLP